MKGKIWKICVVGFALLVAVSISGCGQASPTPSPTVSSPSVSPTATKPIKLFAVAPFEDQYFTTWLDGAKAAAKLLGVDISTATAGWDPAKQDSLIQSAVAAGANGILVARVDLDAFVPLATELSEKGIAIVTTDGPVHYGPRIAHFAADDMELGREVAKALIEGLEKSGKPKPWNVVGFAGLPGTYAGLTRIEGALSILNPLISKGDVVLLATEIANFDRQLGMQKMEALLGKFSKVDGVFGANDDMVIGAMKACEAAGLVPGKDTIFVGIDVIPDAQAAINEGKMYASISQAPYLEGYWGITTLYANLKYGCKPDSVGMPVPTVVVTKDNLNTFQKQVTFDKPVSVELFTNCKDKYQEFVKQFWPE